MTASSACSLVCSLDVREARNRSGIMCAVRLILFFQAAHGIRALTVTGVQTCALPICQTDAPQLGHGDASVHVARAVPRLRSEERRVGKEGTFRSSPCPSKQKTKEL